VLTIGAVCGTDYPITQNQVDEWQELFPAVDVMQELRNCKAWNIANVKKRKTLDGLKRHITTWLMDKQNKYGTRARGGNGNGQHSASYAIGDDDDPYKKLYS